ncbi:MAG: LysR family transcriptional regulator, partial [Oscillospiraceae bacterium]|nr:LysR family transcriptional regulator [Oscillospiraceae bacterium]
MVLPNIYVDNYVALRKGQFYPLTTVEHTRHFYACYRKEGFVPQYVQRFIQIVIEELNYRPETKLTDY